MTYINIACTLDIFLLVYTMYVYNYVYIKYEIEDQMFLKGVLALKPFYKSVLYVCHKART